MNIFTKATLALAAIAAFHQPVAAATFSCTGDAQDVAVDDSGRLFVSWGGFTIHACSVAAVDGGIAPETCRGWFTQFLSARGLAKQVRLFFETSYSTNAGMTTDCSTTNLTGTRRPYFVTLLN